MNPIRRPLIAGNWKMNAGGQDGCALADAVAKAVKEHDQVDVLVSPPFTALAAVAHVLDENKSKVGIAAQNMHAEPSGAFTGEISTSMLKESGATWVILGHSERRHGLGETNGDVNKKLKAALDSKLIPIVCVGELKEERLAEKTEEVLLEQLSGSLEGLTPEQMAGTVLAYEPVWAIGTGLTATPEQAQSAHAFIRGWLGKSFGEATAARVVVQYGGSVKPDNAAELLACDDIDGALVGGASLKPGDFLGIIRAAQEVTARGKA